MSEFVFIPLCFAVFFAVLLAVYNNITVVKRYKLSSKKLSGPLKIVLLSDFHNRRNKKSVQKTLDKIAAQNPDFIVLAGDLVDRRRPNLDIGRDFVASLCKIADTYYVTGNHERALGREDTLRAIDCDGALLDGEYKIFEEFSIVGIPDTLGDNDSRYADLLSIFERLQSYKIAVVHRPIQFDSCLDISKYDIDLVLCGHTHGGVVRIPFFGAFLSPDEGFFPKYSKGVYHKNDTTMVVSGGLGNTFLPLRINNFPEIVVLEINL